ncbi:MAG: amidohydrolase family protein [Candidatus Bathyarchaeia archaeon]
MIDLSDYRVVDDHCHPFSPMKESKPFISYLKLSDLAVPEQDVVNTLLYRHMVGELSRLLGVSRDRVIDERERRYRQDPVEYLKLLFEDAGVDTILVDTGFPSIDNVGYSIDLEEFREIIPCKVREIVRIEGILYDLMRERRPFNSAVESFRLQIHDAVSKGAVGLKTIVAYRTGLKVEERAEGEAKKAYEAVASTASKRGTAREALSEKTGTVKTVFDYFVYLGMEESVRYGLPLQIHTGIGDAPMDLDLSNPLLLHGLIKDPQAKDARLVLIHGGYPFVEESGFLAGSYPNVFIDLSEMIPFSTIGVAEKLLNLLEMTPTNKILYGSDGFNIPELHWLACKRVKKSLSKALWSLVESRELDEDEAKKIARQILSENSKRLYRLTD